MNSHSLDKQPKVLYFSSSRNIGFTYHLAEFACRIGKRQNFLFVSGELEQFPGIFLKLDASGVNRVTIQALDTSKNIIKHLIALRALIKQFDPEIIHTQTNYQLLLISLLKPFHKFKIIQTIHAFGNGNGGLKMHAVKLYITAMSMMFTKKVIFQSSYVKKNFKYLSCKSCDLAMGFETPQTTKSKKTSLPLQIIYAAKFHEAKNHKWLITTLEPLLLLNLIKLNLPGDGELFESIKQLVADRNLSSKVSLSGWINRKEIATNYNEAHLAIVPSKSETLGHNIIEPLAYAIPVISFPVGIAPDISRESSAVQVIDFYAADQMLSLIKRYLNDAVSYEKDSKEALNYFHENLTWDMHIIKYKKILNEL